jgi:hypothetical protein
MRAVRPESWIRFSPSPQRGKETFMSLFLSSLLLRLRDVSTPPRSEAVKFESTTSLKSVESQGPELIMPGVLTETSHEGLNIHSQSFSVNFRDGPGSIA